MGDIFDTVTNVSSSAVKLLYGQTKKTLTSESFQEQVKATPRRYKALVDSYRQNYTADMTEQEFYTMKQKGITASLGFGIFGICMLAICFMMPGPAGFKVVGILFCLGLIFMCWTAFQNVLKQEKPKPKKKLPSPKSDNSLLEFCKGIGEGTVPDKGKKPTAEPEPIVYQNKDKKITTTSR